MTTEAHLHLQYVDGYLITRSHHAAFVFFFFVFLKWKGLILHEEIEKETVKRCYKHFNEVQLLVFDGDGEILARHTVIIATNEPLVLLNCLLLSVQVQMFSS